MWKLTLGYGMSTCMVVWQKIYVFVGGGVVWVYDVPNVFPSSSKKVPNRTTLLTQGCPCLTYIGIPLCNTKVYVEENVKFQFLFWWANQNDS